MSPVTDYGHAVVTAEATIGIIGVALATGLMFAKASRAKASVLFSKAMVTHMMHGKRTLIFRVGNARGNDVVDATITVTALIDEVSPEGHHLRRLHDLKLVRERTPMFVLSWTVMHEVDESSPLYGCVWEGEETQVVSFIVTLTGHDGTYGDTIYARHNYYPKDIRHEHQFVDVISEIEGGRLLIDFEKFHDTEAIAA
jgi:inward rectifier potassium channel